MSTLEDLQASHDDKGGHSHLYAAMLKVARRTEPRPVAVHRAPRQEPQTRTQAVGEWSKARTRSWVRDRTAKWRRRSRVVTTPVAVGVTTARVGWRAARGTVRVATTAARAPSLLLSTVVMLVLLLVVLPLVYPGLGRAMNDTPGLRSLVPGAYDPTTCAVPDVEPVSGVQGIAAGAGRLTHAIETSAPTPADIAGVVVKAAHALGGLRAVFDSARATGQTPTVPTTTRLPQTNKPVPIAALTAGRGSMAEAASAVVAAGETGEPAAELVAIAGAESGYVRDARNPTSSAVGYWQILTRLHHVTAAQASDPYFAARYAVRLRDESPRGLAGPWATTYGVGAHKRYLADARAAVAAAEVGGNAQTVATCPTAPSTEPGTITVGYQGESTAADAAVAAARTKLGFPYVWGATGPDVFDCSGLTMWAYKQAGVSIPRTSRQQYAGLPHVSTNDLLPGDLIFYAYNRLDPSSIHHVSMYIGDGMTLYAPESGDVVKIGPMRWGTIIGAARPATAGATA